MQPEKLRIACTPLVFETVIEHNGSSLLTIHDGTQPLTLIGRDDPAQVSLHNNIPDPLVVFDGNPYGIDEDIINLQSFNIPHSL